MKKIMRVVLSLVLAASLSFTSIAVVKSDKLDELKNQKAAAAANKNKYKKKKSEAKKYLASVDKQLTSVATQIYENKKKLDKTQSDIKMTKKRLKKAT